LNQLTAEETAALELQRSRLSEEEYDHILIEELRQMEGQLPLGLLDRWAPDYAMVRRVGDRIRRKRKRKYLQSVISSAALLVVILGLIVYFFVSRHKEGTILSLASACGQMASGMEIPLSESACTIYAGDSVRIRIGSGSVGEVHQVGNLEISRTPEGILRVRRRSGDMERGAAGPKDIFIHTAAREQCVVDLEDGILIRLNAQSYLRYPQERKESFQLGFGGEAYIQAHRGAVGKVLELRTEHGRVVAKDAEFVVKSTRGETKTLLRNGEVDLFANNHVKPLALMCPHDLGVIKTVATGQKGALRDTLLFVQDMSFESAILWTKAVRRYKDIPLRAFVDEMSRWEGFTIKDWSCIPKDRTITVSVCYRDDRNQVFAAIREAGIKLYEEKGMISFCPDDTKKWGGIKATKTQLAYK
jgi:hypothetical protein